MFQSPRAEKRKSQTFKNRNIVKNFPGGPEVEYPPANAGDMGSIPGPGRFHMPWDNWARAPLLENSPCPLQLQKAQAREQRSYIDNKKKEI